MKCKLCEADALPSSEYCAAHLVEDFSRHYDDAPEPKQEMSAEQILEREG